MTPVNTVRVDSHYGMPVDYAKMVPGGGTRMAKDNVAVLSGTMNCWISKNSIEPKADLSATHTGGTRTDTCKFDRGIQKPSPPPYFSVRLPWSKRLAFLTISLCLLIRCSDAMDKMFGGCSIGFIDDCTYIDNSGSRTTSGRVPTSDIPDTVASQSFRDAFRRGSGNTYSNQRGRHTNTTTFSGGSHYFTGPHRAQSTYEPQRSYGSTQNFFGQDIVQNDAGQWVKDAHGNFTPIELGTNVGGLHNMTFTDNRTNRKPVTKRLRFSEEEANIKRVIEGSLTAAAQDTTLEKQIVNNKPTLEDINKSAIAYMVMLLGKDQKWDFATLAKYRALILEDDLDGAVFDCIESDADLTDCGFEDQHTKKIIPYILKNWETAYMAIQSEKEKYSQTAMPMSCTQHYDTVMNMGDKTMYIKDGKSWIITTDKDGNKTRIDID